MNNKVDLYTGVHKGQRYYLSQLSKLAGNLDVNKAQSVSNLLSEFVKLEEEFRLHALLEEEYIHPLLYDRVPEGARSLEEDHRNQEEKLADLRKYLERLMEKPRGFEKRNEVALEFYRGLNRFIAEYLVHINKEEENIQPSLWNLCTSAELAIAFNSIVSSMNPEELSMNLRIMIPAMNIDERVMLLTGIRESIPIESFKEIHDLAESVLNPEDWEELQERMENQ